MTNTLHAFDFLESPREVIPPVCVLFGGESFLKGLARQVIAGRMFEPGAETSITALEGDGLEWRDVVDELSTASLFGGGKRRMVVIDEADRFVGKFRSQLQDYVARPRRTGVLVLDVGTWASNTNLYKAINQVGLQVDCRFPEDTAKISKWLVARAAAHHQVKLDSAAARLLVDISQPDLGMMDQDLAKLSLLCGPKGKVDAALVQNVVGGWKAKTIWETVEAAAEGNAAEALRHLDLALQSAEPIALFAPISWSLRRFGVATRIFERAERRGERISLRDALTTAGFKNWPLGALNNAERQLKQMGRDRAGQLLKWLSEADLALKGSHSKADRARFVLEQLFLKLAKRKSV